MAKRKDSRRKESKKPQPSINGETLRRAVAWTTDQKIFAHLKLHGNTTWNVVHLILLAVVWVWSNDSTLTGAFKEAHRWCLDVLGYAAVNTYQGLISALETWTASWLPLLWDHLHGLMERYGGKHWRVGRWLPLAVDGSRISVPRTKKNEDAFCAPNFGNSATAKYRRKKKVKSKRLRRKTKPVQPVKPQIWITLLWHMGLQMPWSWKTGPSYAAERDHFQQMLREQKYPKDTLFCGDAGFTGYELWKTIIDTGHSFLIRVGGNVKLLRKLGYVREKAGFVYCWPNEAARRKQRPLVLRLLQVRVGDRLMYLLTSVLDDKALSDADAVQLYRFRWGIETLFYEVTQTLQCEVDTLCYPPAALFVFCLALMAANAVAVLKAAVRAAHGVEEADAMSAYYMALEIRQVLEGMMIALPAEDWIIFRTMSVATFAAHLKEMAAHMDLGYYRKSKRGPKKPPPPKNQYRNGGHVSTYKLLKEKAP